MEVKATAATPMAMTTSVKLNAAERRRGIRGLRGEGVKVRTSQFRILDFSPLLRDMLARGCWIVERCESMKVRK